jgi:hypothetical protein
MPLKDPQENESPGIDVKPFLWSNDRLYKKPIMQHQNLGGLTP